MELDMYKVFELLLKYPNIEIKLELNPYVDPGKGLHIRVIDYSAISGAMQKCVTLCASDMDNMRGSFPITSLVESMIEEVMKGDET